MKRVSLFILMCALLLSVLCVPGVAETTLEVYCNANGIDNMVFQKVCDDFTAETGIKIDLVCPGDNYEELLKVRMASNNMPDLWSTHGWAVARYSEYLYTLNEQPFAGDISPLIMPMITDSEGLIYTLPVNVDLCGMTCNTDVLEAAGIDPKSIVTWADFTDACAALKEQGIRAIAIGGKDIWTAGAYFNYVAGPWFDAEGDDNFTEQLLDGTFDWNLWGEVTQLYADWYNAGYINEDCLTADYDTAMRLLAENKAAFFFHGASSAASARSKNPEANITMIPWPSKNAEQKQQLYAGEHISFGVWKDSKHLDEALQLLNYFASADAMSYMATASGMPAGLVNVESETGNLSDFYDYVLNNENIRSVPYFDRSYLPSGMWDDMCVTSEFVLGGDEDAVEHTVEYMRDSYEEKLDQ